MAIEAANFNGRTSTKTTVRLPDVYETNVRVASVMGSIERASRAAREELEAKNVELAQRIEANRLRSARSRHPAAPTNGHRGDVTLKLTNHGLMRTCTCCGQALPGKAVA